MKRAAVFCLALPVGVALLVGCAGPAVPEGAPGQRSEQPTTVGGPHVYAPSDHLVVGRVRAVDFRTRTVVVTVSLFLNSAPVVEGRPLLTRNDALTTTARLTGIEFQRGQILGARLLSGRPQPGDEVVLLTKEIAPSALPATAGPQ